MSQDDRAFEASNEGFYPIRHVCSVTGINPVTLRAWERRHNLVAPTRTPKGHRLYSDADIEQIREILTLLEEGIPISQVPRALDTRRQIRAASFGADRFEPENGEGSTDAGSTTWPGPLEAGDERFVLEELRGDPAAQQLLLALVSPESGAFNDRCKRLEIHYDWDRLYGQSVYLLYNVLRADGRRNASSKVALAMLSSQLELRLAQQLCDWRELHQQPRLLVCNPGSGHRRLPGLLLAVACARRGAHVTLIGDVLDAVALQIILTRSQSRALVLSVTTQVVRSPQSALLDEMMRHCSVPVFLTGTAASSLEKNHRAGGPKTSKPKNGVGAHGQAVLLPNDALEAADLLLTQFSDSTHRKPQRDAAYHNGFTDPRRSGTPNA